MPRPTGASGCSSSAELSWSGIPAQDIARWWDAASPFIERALAEGRGEYAASDIEAALRVRAMQLWLLGRNGTRGSRGISVCGALVTEITNYPRRRTAILRLFSTDPGLRAAWLPLTSVLESWARAQGCDAIEVFGRPGWAKVLDYELTHIVLCKELKNE